MAVFAVFIYWPAIYSFYLSFFNTTTSTGNVFIGFSNYLYLFQVSGIKYPVWIALLNSAIFALSAFSLTTAIFAWFSKKRPDNPIEVLSMVIAPVIAVIATPLLISHAQNLYWLLLLWIFIGLLSYLPLRGQFRTIASHSFIYLIVLVAIYFTFHLLLGQYKELYSLFYDVAQVNPFVISIWNTLYFVIIDVPFMVAISLVSALLMKNLRFFKAFFRTAFFTPYVASIVAISLVWMWMFNYHYGLLNYMLSWLGVPAINWLNNAALTMPTVAIMTIWQYFGYYGLIFLSGLQNIDQEYYEAAEIEGANSFQKFTNITWPLLSPITFFVVVISLINAFQVFAQVYVLYNQMPGPYANSGLTMVFYIYNTFYNNQQMGLASAAAYVLLAIIMVLTLVQFKTSEKRVEYNV